MSKLLPQLCFALALTYCASGPVPEPRFDQVIVAEVGNIEELPCGWPDVDRDLPPGVEKICTGSAYSATLTVRETFLGDLQAGSEITLEPVSLIGTYPQRDSRYILGPFITSRKDARQSTLWSWGTVVFPTTDGGFASCGCGEADQRNYPNACRRVEFDPPVRAMLKHKSPFFFERISENNSWEFENGVAVCKKGIPADVIARSIIRRHDQLIRDEARAAARGED